MKASQFKRELKNNQKYYDYFGAKVENYSEKESQDLFQKKIKQKFFRYPENRKLRVFWVGTDEHQDRSGFLQSLSELCEVVEFYNDQGGYGQVFSESLFDFEVQFRNGKQFRRLIDKFEVDIVLGQMLSNYLPKDALEYAASKNIPIINIAMDDRLPYLWRKNSGCPIGAAGYLEAVDLTLTTCSDVCSRYSFYGMPSLFWPLASDENIFYPNKVKDIDLCFIGNRYGVRDEIVSYLIKNGVNVTVYGAGWPLGRVDHELSPSIFGRSKVVLGIGTVGHCEDVYTLKLRDFDALMSGAAYITHRNPDLELIFEEGSQILFYESKRELLMKVNDLLLNEKLRNRISSEGRKVAVEKHTWNYRISSLLEMLKEASV
ncbi:CgeB family protein [Halobacteriovorax marinus]|uniref:CgeB family protein n=1 Tax=Halobacteriovorax marinus TaxID=97084 RepID=UPI0012FDDA6C|nr:glycosyltransferase [Halobacteriovorax marinus]